MKTLIQEIKKVLEENSIINADPNGESLTFICVEDTEKHTARISVTSAAGEVDLVVLMHEDREAVVVHKSAERNVALDIRDVLERRKAKLISEEINVDFGSMKFSI